MTKLREKLSKKLNLRNDEDGLTTVEYAIVLVLIAIVAIGAWGLLGKNVSKAAKKGADAIGNLGD
ncbi:MAG: hypothetical protein R3A78_01785 [Polyangiales bacterium]